MSSSCNTKYSTANPHSWQDLCSSEMLQTVKLWELIRPTYRKHQHREYTNKTVQIVYTKLTISMYCNYNSWHSSCFTDCILSSTVTITYVNILIYWFCWVVSLMIFITLAKQTDKAPWRWCGCIETCSSTYDIKILFIYIYIYIYVVHLLAWIIKPRQCLQ